MILVTDLGSSGNQHEQFNTSFLKSLQIIDSTEKIEFYGEAEHTICLRTSLHNNDQILFKDLSFYNKRGGIREVFRAIYQLRNALRLYKRAEKLNAKKIYILLIHPFAHCLLKWFANPNIQVNIIVHGELESLKFNKHFLNKICGLCLRNAFLRVKSNFSYIILGQTIFTNLKCLLPAIEKNKVIIYDHPYPFTEYPIKTNFDSLSFGIFGVATVYKKAQYFFTIAKTVATFSSIATFRILGKVYTDMNAYLNPYVLYRKPGYAFTREELRKAMYETTFSVFYYSNEDHSLCPSGSFWDSIDAETPLLYVKNDYFDYYASMVGGIGYSFDSPVHLNEYIEHLCLYGINIKEYYSLLKNIRELKYKVMNINKISLSLTA